MKVFLVLVLCGLVSLCCAEPQRYRSGRLRSKALSRQEAAPSEDPAPTAYPPSGWKPEGGTLELPTEQSENLVPPATQYGAPIFVFTPEAAEEPEAEELEVEEPLANEPEAEEFDPEAEAAAPAAQVGRLRSLTARQRAPAKLRRARF